MSARRPPAAPPLDIRLMSSVARWVWWAWLVVALAVAAVALLRDAAWPIKRLEVGGDMRHLNVSAVRTQVLARVSGNFLSVDLAHMQSLLEGLPWVRQAQVQRVFPHTLRVTLQEHQVLAWWGEVGGERLINTHAEGFDAPPDQVPDEGLPVLMGPPARETEVAQAWLALRDVFAPTGQTLQRLSLDARGSWHAWLANDGELALGQGPASDWIPRVQALVQSAKQWRSQAKAWPKRIDLRYRNGYAVQWSAVSRDIFLPMAAHNG
jgi:cell division protein FtsQ